MIIKIIKKDLQEVVLFKDESVITKKTLEDFMDDVANLNKSGVYFFHAGDLSISIPVSYFKKYIVIIQNNYDS